MNKLEKTLDNLGEQDLYSLMLFCMYMLKGTQEYSSLSELAFILDKDSLLELCEYFGGQTITIPTIDEFENMIDGLLLYKAVNIDGKNYNEALANLDYEDLSATKKCYNTLCEVLKNYNIQPRTSL